jgi:GrpB-like predicted nucleotidyltransferase (UPF0157 family)
MTCPSSPLGLARGSVRLTAHDPRWATLFRREARRLSASVARSALPPLVIEHVGSSAVPDLVAKPILDILAGRAQGIAASEYVPWLAMLGYEARGEQGVAGRELLVLGPSSARTHHLHLVALGSREWNDALVFRDRLRAEPALATAYGALKLDLAARHAGDRSAYTDGKAPFIAAAIASHQHARP